LRDRALIGVMVYFFARRIGACFAHTGAALGRTVEDV
jgi:hypothetical protein